MIKILLTGLQILLIWFAVNAQSVYNSSEKQFNAGIGLTGTGFPVFAGVDFNYRKNITLGVEGSLRAYNENWNGNTFSQTIFGISGNGNYHFSDRLQIPKEWDIYAGINIGYYFWFTPSGYHGSNSSGLGVGGQLGGRYFFTKTLGLNFELTGGTSLVGCKIGITYKF